MLSTASPPLINQFLQDFTGLLFCDCCGQKFLLLLYSFRTCDIICKVVYVFVEDYVIFGCSRVWEPEQFLVSFDLVQFCFSNKSPSSQIIHDAEFLI